MKTVLVTGGSGLVGNAIKCVSSNYNEYNFVYASSKDVNLINFTETLSYFEKIKPQYIIHLAAKVGGLYKNITNNVDMFEDNIYINTNVIKCAYKVGVKNLIACLSTCVYPDKVTYPITEEQFHNGEPNNSNYGYSYSKRMLEVQCRAYNKQYDVNYKCVIPTNIYGPHDNFSLTDGHVIPALIHKFYLAKQNGNKLILPGTGSSIRQFIYSEDVAKQILEILFQNTKYATYNLCNEKEISINDLVKIIANNYNYHNYSFDFTSSDGQHKKSACNVRLQSEFGIFDSELKNKINYTINWFKTNVIIARK